MSEQQPVFSIEKLYVKDLSLEVPNAPFIFMEQEAPNIEVQLQNNGSAVGEGMYEVVLTVTVTAKNGDKGYFLVEAAQAGIFRIEGIPEEAIEPIMAIACPNVLFPYARETISDAVNRAGFPPVILAPVNFEAIYQQRQADQAQTASGEVPIQ